MIKVTKKIYNLFYIISFWFLLIAHMELEKSKLVTSKNSKCIAKYLNINYMIINVFCIVSSILIMLIKTISMI